MVEHERIEDTPGPLGSPARPPRAARPTTSADVPSPARSSAAVLALQRSHGNAAVARLLAGGRDARPAIGGSGLRLARVTGEAEELVPDKEESARFEGDPMLARIDAGTKTLAKGDTGLAVVKLQEALVDLGFAVAVSGSFNGQTETALKAFQASVAPALLQTGVLDQSTLAALDARFDTRQPYIANATFDPAVPARGTRALTASDKAAVKQAMVPPRGAPGAPSTFKEVVGGKAYDDELRDRLTDVIDSLHKELFEDKKPLRADPAKNFHSWTVMEGPAAAAKEVTDKLYGTYATAPAMTHALGNFIDQWEDEVARDAALNTAAKKQKATDKVWYLIASNCHAVNAKHSAVPSDAREKAILDPIVESFVNTPAKVRRLLELDVGWEGAQLAGVVYLQRYKQDTDDENRAQMWELFHTCIHEYIHSLADPKFQAYARKLDSVRYNTLIEGFDDFFTETVRKTIVADTALRKKIEGPYYDATVPVPAVSPGIYPSIAQAEQVVSIVGIRNAEAAYFNGDVSKIGGS
jgi:hypothetical protein